HRDIKPENILIHKGRPMVADFGIALAVSAAAGGRMTETGLSLGTPHYMSPEQATAEKDLTNRSDLYSLGSVLYEMLTGNAPHVGASAQQIIMKIVTEAAQPVTTLRKSVPPNVSAAVAKALEKLPADRFATARELIQALADQTFRHGAVTSVGEPAPIPARRSLAATGTRMGLALAIGLGLGWMIWNRPASPPLLIRMTVYADSVHAISNNCCGPSIAFSRDGEMLAFLADGPDGARLFVRRMDQFESRPVPGTEMARTPFLSPDGRWLGFLQDGALRKVDLQGGAPQTVARVDARVRGAEWTESGEIIFSNDGDGGLYRVSSEGGTPELITLPDTTAGERIRGLARLLPGGRALLYSSWKDNVSAPEAWINVFDLERRTSRRVTAGLQPYYAETGHLVFAQSDGSIMAQQFDVRSLELSGEPVRIAERVIVHTPSPEAEFVVSLTGSLAYRQGDAFESALEEFSIDGSLIATHRGRARRASPRYSPDGRQIAYEQYRENSENSDIWVLDLASGIDTRLSTGGRDRAPIWSLDGRFVRWSDIQGSPGDSAVLMSRPADLSAPATPFGAEPYASGILGLPARSPGPIPFAHVSGGSMQGIWIVDADGSNPRPWRESPYTLHHPALSPSGRWIAYESDRSGRSEVYVQPFPGGGAVTRVSTDGGLSPVWATDQRLVFRSTDGALMRVDLDMTGPRPRPTTYRSLASAVKVNVNDLTGHNYSVSPDGMRVVVLRQSGSPTLLVETNRLHHLPSQAR
ncbi:MAG: protein kinase, partial [Gemmatimonadales bacterium]